MRKVSLWSLVAPCGLYCGECTAFIEQKCGGCRSNQGLSEQYRRYCKIYKCSSVKGFKVCLECNEFPCKTFNFFRAEGLEGSSWFLDVLSNMKQITEMSIANFLKRKAAWLNKRKKCASQRGIKYCDECKRWPCELLKRPVLVPADLNRFKEFMEKEG